MFPIVSKIRIVDIIVFRVWQVSEVVLGTCVLRFAISEQVSAIGTVFSKIELLIVMILYVPIVLKTRIVDEIVIVFSKSHKFHWERFGYDVLFQNARLQQ